jgi:hypothetical protein
MAAMNFQKIAMPILGVVLVVAAYRAYAWAGVALVVSGVIMWMLLHFTRAMKVLQRASARPVGYCDSAVMLNVKLRPGVSLLHVVAMTRSLGDLVSEKEAQPEVYRWTDGGASHVTGEFADGKLVKWALFRPEAPDEKDRSP